MAFNKKIFMNEVKKHKEGIMIGVGVGLFAAYYTISQGGDLASIAASGSGLLDNILTRSTFVGPTESKVYLVFGILGGLVGFAVDKFIPTKTRTRSFTRSRKPAKRKVVRRKSVKRGRR